MDLYGISPHVEQKQLSTVFEFDLESNVRLNYS
jgi:hypothetical protein